MPVSGTCRRQRRVDSIDCVVDMGSEASWLQSIRRLDLTGAGDDVDLQTGSSFCELLNYIF